MKILFGILFILVSLSFSNELKAQTLVDDANLSMTPESSNSFSETIKIISPSKKIFILSNNNQQLGPGDFISLAFEDKLAARAIVAKTHQGQVGIKIVKIYSLSQWAKLRRNLEVQIIKGDDSTFEKKPTATTATVEDKTKIKTEEDLYNAETVVEDEINVLDETKARHIKPDNIVSVSGSYLYADEIKSKGGRLRGTELGASWAFQFIDNYFFEAFYGRATFNSFPNDGKSTLVNHFIGRLKYNVKGPLYTFIMPYVGYQSFTVSSPDAGDAQNPALDSEELKAVNNLKKSGPVVGVTVLRRLVPGWFVKGNLGTDLIDLGFAIEF